MDFVGEEPPLSVLQERRAAARPFVGNAQTFDQLMLCWEAHVPQEVHLVCEAILALSQGPALVKLPCCTVTTSFQACPGGQKILELCKQGICVRMHEDALYNKVVPLFQSGDITEPSLDRLHGWMLELAKGNGDLCLLQR